MSLADLREISAGIAEAGGAVSGRLLAAHKTHRYPFHLFIFPTSSEEATQLKDLCFSHSTGDKSGSAWSELMDSPGVHEERDCLVVAATDWVETAWLGVSTFQALAVSASPSQQPDQVVEKPDACGRCLSVSRTVTNWRKYISSLFFTLSNGSYAEEGSGLAFETDPTGAARVVCVPLNATMHLRSVKLDGRQLSAWCASRLAKEWRAAQATLQAARLEKEALEACLTQTRDKLEKLQKQHDQETGVGGLLAHSLGDSSDPASAPTAAGAASGRKRPVSLINPQSRTGAKRAKGLRLQ